MDVTRTPSPEHLEFERLCARVDEWEHLPARTVAPPQLEDEPRREGETPFDGQILAGLVSPV